MFGIITPVYKHWNFIGGLIYSLRRQTFEDWKLYIYNDEPDAEATIYTDDDRVMIINDGEHLGHVKRYNQGIRRSSEPYLIFVGADDFFYDNNVLSKFNNAIQGYRPRWVISDFASLYEDNILTQHYYHHQPNTKNLSWKNGICHSGTVIEKETIKKFMYNEGLKWAEDWELWLLMRSQGIEPFYLPITSIVRREYTSQTRLIGKTKWDHLKNRIDRILIKRKFRVKW